MVMYQVEIVPLVGDKDCGTVLLPQEETIFKALLPLQEKGLVINGKIIVERRMVNVEKIAKIVTFQLLSAVGKTVAHAYLKQV